MNTQFPVAPPNYSPTFFNLLLQQLTRYFGLTVSQDQEAPRIVLRSPNGTNYDLTVSDVGVLAVTPTSKTRG
jgi:hypothetical protein